MKPSEYDAIEAELLKAIDTADATADGARVMLNNLSTNGQYAFTCALLTIDTAAKAYDSLVQAAKLLRDTLAREKS
jgi:hypothetical protein